MEEDNRCTVPFDGRSRIVLHTNSASGCCKTPLYPIDHDTGVLTKELIELRTSIVNNERSPQCINCWKIDDEGGPSYRRRHSTHFGKLIDWNKLDIYQPVRNIEVLFSNKCQMMCVYCSSDISSMWENYDNKHNPIKIVAYKHTRKLEEIIDVSNLRVILFSGGEPLLEPECVDFIMKLPYEKTRELSIVTNLSYGSNVFDTLKNIIHCHPSIFVVCSLDSLGENLNRKYLNWDLWKKNFEELIYIKPRGGIIINITVTILNYKDVQGIIEYILDLRKIGISDLSFNINPIETGSRTSLASGRLDSEYSIQLSDSNDKYLTKKEKALISSYNLLLRKVEYSDSLAEETNRFLENYLE